MNSNRLGRLALWLSFIVAMSLTATMFVSCNITEVRMADRDRCWDSLSATYKPCVPQR